MYLSRGKWNYSGSDLGISGDKRVERGLWFPARSILCGFAAAGHGNAAV